MLPPDGGSWQPPGNKGMAESGTPPPPASSVARRQPTDPASALSSGAVFSLGALATACWMGALALDSQTTQWPGWMREALHAALVLAVPLLILLIGRRHRLSAPRTAIVLLVLIVASLPALLPVETGNGLISLPVRLPTPGLGVALGAIVPLRRSVDRDGAAEVSAATVAGIGAALVVALAGFIIYSVGRATESCAGHSLACGGLEDMLVAAICIAVVLALPLAVGAAALGGKIGSALARTRR